jgi:hypothetical protein
MVDATVHSSRPCNGTYTSSDVPIVLDPQFVILQVVPNLAMESTDVGIGELNRAVLVSSKCHGPSMWNHHIIRLKRCIVKVRIEIVYRPRQMITRGSRRGHRTGGPALPVSSKAKRRHAWVCSNALPPGVDSSEKAGVPPM